MGEIEPGLDGQVAILLLDGLFAMFTIDCNTQLEIVRVSSSATWWDKVDDIPAGL